ncbi:hypothetical protein JCM19039_2203 [Geomicrobium sp. JCM 19039]|nr:hypothetical protein JCM19039_2203 [Geomicrobium sp. JCM 19039]
MQSKNYPLRIFRPGVELLNEIDQYESMIHTRRWSGVGDFQLVINQNSVDISQLEINNLIMIGNDVNRVGRILHREAAVNQAGAESELWTIQGVTLEGIAKDSLTLAPADRDYEQRKWVMDVSEGRDLTQGQSDNPPVIFSPEIDSVAEQQFLHSIVDYVPRWSMWLDRVMAQSVVSLLLVMAWIGVSHLSMRGMSRKKLRTRKREKWSRVRLKTLTKSLGNGGRKRWQKRHASSRLHAKLLMALHLSMRLTMI